VQLDPENAELKELLQKGRQGHQKKILLPQEDRHKMHSGIRQMGSESKDPGQCYIIHKEQMLVSLSLLWHVSGGAACRGCHRLTVAIPRRKTILERDDHPLHPGSDCH
jgi:hypothetical protein